MLWNNIVKMIVPIVVSIGLYDKQYIVAIPIMVSNHHNDIVVEIFSINETYSIESGQANHTLCGYGDDITWTSRHMEHALIHHT